MEEQKGTTEATSVDDPFKLALHAKLLALAQQAISPRMLLELEQSARLARQFLMVSADPRALRRMRFGVDFTGDDAGLAGEMIATPGEPEVVGSGSLQTFASAPKSETFGVTVIRELIAALSLYNKPSAEPSNKGLSAGDLAYGITIAKESNMPDVEEKLRKRLTRLLGDMTEEDGSPRVIDAPVAPTEQGAAA